jgi:DNA-binding NtrC family response regulator
MNFLIVEDNRRLSAVLCEEIERRGDTPRQAATLRETETVLHDFWPDVVLLDAIFPADTGSADFNAPGVLSLLENRLEDSRPIIILMSGDDRAAGHFDTIRDWWYTRRIADMVSKNQEGGWKFLSETLLHHVHLHCLTRSHIPDDAGGEQRAWLARNGIISRDQSMCRIADAIQRIVANTDNTHSILIVGANGTGKTLIAEAVCNEMRRRHKEPGQLPFFRFNCGRIQMGTFHGELFGHERGAYTSAEKSGYGALEMAGEGVLFLDDIQMLPEDARHALLAPVQDRVFRRLGGEAELRFRARLVCATNVDLEKMSAEGTMPDEFYNRVAGSTLFVPPLSQRPADVEEIAVAFAARAPRPVNLRADVIRAMQAYGWPGSVRQLGRVVEQIKINHSADTVTLPSLRALGLEYLGKPIEWVPSGADPVPAKPLQGFGWQGSWADLGPEHGQLVLEWLRGVVPDGAGLDALVKSLENRTAPKPIHYYKALLFAYVRAEKLPHKAFEEALGLRWDFTNRIVAYLANIRNGATPGFDPPFLHRASEGGKYVYTIADRGKAT